MELKKQLIGILNKMKKILPNDYNFILPYSPESLFRLGTNKDGGYVIDKKIVDRTNILVSFGGMPQTSAGTHPAPRGETQHHYTHNK